MKYNRNKPWISAFDNDFGTDNRAFYPEFWAQESLMVLEATTVMAGLVHRDFEDIVASEGDTVNTRKPGKFTANRKSVNDNVTIQDAAAEKIAVKLNQHLHTTFIIKDEQMSKSFKDLVAEYLVPAVESIAQAVDKILIGEVYQFLDNRAGYLGTAATKTAVIDIGTVMNNNKVPAEGRVCVASPNTIADLLNVSEFTKVNEAGDDGSALRNAQLGQLFGIEFFMSQNIPSIVTTDLTTTTNLVTNGAHAAGATTIIYDGYSGDIIPGSYCKIGTDLTPQYITAASDYGNDGFTISPGLKRAVADGQVITIYDPGTINDTIAANLAADYAGAHVIDGVTIAPQEGQGIRLSVAALGSPAVASTAKVYAAFKTPTIIAMELTRPLDVAIVNNSTIGLVPPGEYNFAFLKNALALVSRPLATPPDGIGAKSAVVSFKGLSIRVTIGYDQNKQGIQVTVDLLCGVKTLDTDFGCVLLA